jgi:hypothetical protein
MRVGMVSVFVVAFTVAFFASTRVANAAQVCANGDSITMGEYWLNSNLWGASSGSGSQCISSGSQSGSTISWSTNWNWTGSSNSVKSYDSSVLGWQWGWQIANTGLPIALSSNDSVNTSWSFNLNQTTAGGIDISYDTWFSPNANLGNANPSDEVMVWLYNAGGISPVGSPVASYTIDGTSWELWEGGSSWEVHTFVRTSNTTSASLNLMDFYKTLVSRGTLNSSEYLLSVQSGTEIFTGAGTLNTTAYSTTIGGSSSPTPTPTPTRGTTPTPTPTQAATPTPTPTRGTSPTPTPTVSSGSSCAVTYTITNQWQGGFGASLTIKNTGSTAINSWTLQFSFANGQTITQLWNGSYTQSGGAVTITNESYNGSIPPGTTLNSAPGFNGTWTGSNAAPTSFTLNGVACSA